MMYFYIGHPLPIDEENGFSGQPIGVGDYYPPDSDIQDIFQEYKSDWLDTPYLTRSTRLKNNDISLISTSNHHTDVIKDDGIDIDIEQYHPFKSKVRLKNNDTSIKKIYNLEIKGKVLFRKNKKEALTPDGSINPIEYISRFIFSQERAERLSNAVGALLYLGAFSYTFVLPKDLNLPEPGHIVFLNETDPDIETLALITEKTIHDDSPNVSFVAMGIYPFSSMAVSNTGSNTENVYFREVASKFDIYKQIVDGYNFSINDIVVATTTPEKPNINITSTNRDIYISWNRQSNLTGLSIYYELQIKDEAFTTEYLNDGYSIGPNGDSLDSWKGDKGAVTVLFGNSVVLTNLPINWSGDNPGSGVPSARTYYFRLRCRQSYTKISPWTEMSVSVAPINELSMAHDSVSEQMIKSQAVTKDKVATGVLEALIASIRSYITISETGFTGANYDLSNGGHAFSISDRRAYIDQDEFTIQKVVSVSPENIPTWADVMTIGGALRSIILRELGQRIGFDLDGENEYSIAFGKALADYTSSPDYSPDIRYVDIATDGGIGISNSDTGKLTGYFDTLNERFKWTGLAQLGDSEGIGNSAATIYIPGFIRKVVDESLKENHFGIYNSCKDYYAGISADYSHGNTQLGTYAGKGYYEMTIPDFKYNSQHGELFTAEEGDPLWSLSKDAADYVNRCIYIETTVYCTIDIKSSTHDSALNVWMAEKLAAGATLVDGTTDIRLTGRNLIVGLDFLSLGGKQGVYRIAVSVGHTFYLTESEGTYKACSDNKSDFYFIDPDGIVQRSQNSGTTESSSFSLLGTTLGFGGIHAYINNITNTPNNTNIDILSLDVNRKAFIYERDSLNWDLRKTLSIIDPSEYKNLYFSSIGHSDAYIIPPEGKKLILAGVDLGTATTLIAGPSGATGEKGDKGEKGDTTIVGNIDGGHAGSIYGSDQIIDCGGAV